MDNPQIKTEKLLKYGKKQLTDKGVETQATTIREVLDDISNVTASEPTQYGAYNIEVVEKDDGTQELHITDAVEKPVDRLQWMCDNFKSLNYLFYNRKIDDIDVSPILDGLDMRNVASVNYMFAGAKINIIPYFDTSNITNMAYMFSGTTRSSNLLAEVFDELPNVEKFNTKNVTTMAQMFNGTKVKKLDLSNWDTSNVINMESMFYYCKNLTELDLSNWNTSNVTTMFNMFHSCRFGKLDVSSFNTSNVTNMQGVFTACENLTSLNLSNFDTSNVTTMYCMFYNCKALTELDLSHFITSNVTNMASMFHGCDVLTSLDLSSFDTSNVTNMDSMFRVCSDLTTLDVSSFDTSLVTTMSNMFSSCESLVTIIGTIDMIKATSINNMFNGCKALESVTLKNIKKALQIGSGTTYGHLLTLDTLINTIKELWDYSGGTTTYKLTIGNANLEKIANVYVKLITPTEEQIAADPNITSKKPCVVCDSTEEGAMLLNDYALSKNWIIQ